MQTGDSKPGNINTNELDLNNGGWIVIGILIGIIVILSIILLVRYFITTSKIDKLQSLFKNEISNKEMKMILTYRELNDEDKSIINDTLKSLSKHHTDTD